ncbi:phosphoglucosamine mutase [Nitratiruptor sp. SB155-2]|uniref:Phosphoglucosamine mutase n=1 Tax=Nitratiruptor sp. (strain SB155-2) TaxID=387092 RepID=GLMM_NITSB|nr:phosphoglucosamine mutase [Nitratiruptor sp. SB155-2]A6Q164.1 RecName: Full=Phosphoglucosamine mutase [Nitratiruptor sp. SB155-2]BAF69223.1 phosphoglucosamine mutase [Nitratiruptor sp. SB155-2]
MELFGTDGVRGKAGKLLSAQLSMRLAMAAGIYFRKNSRTNKIVVGKDTRRSGYMIENALVSGLTAVGYNVIQVGPMPTPAIAFLTEDLRCDAGIMISASHNPYYDNGIKFFNHQGDKLQPEDEKAIEAIFFDEQTIEENQKTDQDIGSSKRIDDVIGRYIVHLKNSFPKDLTLNGLRVVIDTANGAAYKVAPTVFSELGAEVFVINDEPNGFNINEKCGAMYPGELAKKVREYRADIGFALDGDADRLVVVDEKGKIVPGDLVIGALATYLKQEGMLQADAIVATVMSNKALEDYLATLGIELVRSNVGDKYVLDEMKKRGINFGGESSGHIIFGDYSKTGDGIVTALQITAYMLRSQKGASEILYPFSLYPSKMENVTVKEKKPLETIEEFPELQKRIEKSGIRSLIRYSGTENKLRILLEGKDQKKLEKLMEELIQFFKERLS